VLNMFSKKVFHLRSLKQIHRDFEFYRALKLLFDTSARTYDYIFSSVQGMSARPPSDLGTPLTFCSIGALAREEFIQVVTGIQKSNNIPPTINLPSSPVDTSPETCDKAQQGSHCQENISVFMASWNMGKSLPKTAVLFLIWSKVRGQTD